jgi:MoxR-like ATPase
LNFEDFKSVCDAILEAVGNVFVGENMLLRKVLTAALANGHILFEDYPGLGKTLLAKVFAKVIGCSWRRIQFTPDLMPADIIGTRVWNASRSEFVLERGPIFTNVLLADEINRSPPKTQSALLEAMEERQVTIEGETQKLENPFFVIATQNPIELEGTFPLPEAQLDRFLVKMSTGYVKSLELECEILKRRIGWKVDDPTVNIKPVTSQKDFIEMQNLVENKVYVDPQILEYIAKIVRATRVHPAVEVGASPRGGLALLKLSRAHAALCGRDFVTPDDVKMFAKDALCHRIIIKMDYAFEGKVTPESIVDEIVLETEVPKNFMRK